MAEAVVIDTDEAGFERDVLEESRKRPVVVDFWASWCGPCRVLGPILERLATEAGGRFRLVKVNADENPGLSAEFGVQGIPSVKAFRDGRLVDEFVGALPEAQVRAWLAGFLPGPADDEVTRAQALEASGKTAEARAAYERALEHDPRHAAALFGLATLEAAAGENEAAERHLDLILPDGAAPLAREIAALRLQLQAKGAGGLEAAQARAEAAPDDLEAQVALGRALAAAGRHEAALETLLQVVRKSPGVGAGDDARAAMVEVFGAIGARSELADRFRALLAAELYK